MAKFQIPGAAIPVTRAVVRDEVTEVWKKSVSQDSKVEIIKPHVNPLKSKLVFALRIYIDNFSDAEVKSFQYPPKTKNIDVSPLLNIPKP